MKMSAITIRSIWFIARESKYKNIFTYKLKAYPKLIKNPSLTSEIISTKLKNLEKKIEKNVKSFKLLQEAFVFDYFDNKKINILKVGYRFKFQSSTKSPTDREID